MELVTNIGLKSLRIFLSYADEDKFIVGELKRLLEYRGFEVFVAHDDIKPTKIWEDEIIKNLKRCDLFIPIISDNFKKSDWADQETGIAFNENKLIIPMYMDLPPYGFIHKIQGLKINKDQLEMTANDILEIIKENEKFKNEINDFIINSFLGSLSFDQANARAIGLRSITLTKEQLQRLIDGTLQNNQIRGGYTSKKIVKSLFKRYERYIEKDKFIELIGQ